ncbi:Os08g0240200 [Oryza sativa Japonica Group]|uniref:Os08g0240200 protein n=2 Tax=Oryza sativa subsp. japonica TaxID=39947 RepID=C7J5L0_ORYSJ|nr:hypothetical protein EE612_042992 [Oryza sativa]KAF2918753.1 hypothetical protein DAI22_08g080100 [Oryza sativa Japonica Group]BAH94187.1 Os08g0240500 [Oryza sativa Japonica Group]BAT04488.1 Os08g0240200 [Oryza sativa Japonica Group]|eukprot:NP_001175459.1 Os08g0240500 [Oryza sativa Japonica Group]
MQGLCNESKFHVLHFSAGVPFHMSCDSSRELHSYTTLYTAEHLSMMRYDFPNSNCNIGGQSLMTSSTSLTYKKTRTTSNTGRHRVCRVHAKIRSFIKIKTM